jgi:hypothetical protein
VGKPALDLLIVLRYRRAVTYGFHTLLAALEEHATPVSYDVRFPQTVDGVAAEIEAGLEIAERVLVLWSFYSPDAPALAAELARIRVRVDSPRVLHVAGGVHASAEQAQTLDAGWDVAAVGEGETTLLRLVDAAGQPAGVPGLAHRDAAGGPVRASRAERRPLDSYRAFPLRWKRFTARHAVARRPARRRRPRHDPRGVPPGPAGCPLRPLGEATRPRGPARRRGRGVPTAGPQPHPAGDRHALRHDGRIWRSAPGGTAERCQQRIPDRRPGAEDKQEPGLPEQALRVLTA